MKYLMIHDISRRYFDLKLDQYRLTFDDGLFSQYYYFPEFNRLRTPLIYFVATAFIKPGAVRRMFYGDYLACKKSRQYMYETFIRDEFGHFMRIEEVQRLARYENVCIGAHSHFHDVVATRTRPGKIKPVSRWKKERFKDYPEGFEKEFAIRSKLAFQGYRLKNNCLSRRTETQWEDYIKYDTQQCLNWFEVNLGKVPDAYCFPFNEYTEKMISILKSCGFKKFFGARGKGRPDIIERIDVDSLTGD